MKKPAAIIGTIIAVLAIGFVLDWYVLGAGPVTAIAKARCVNAEEDSQIPAYKGIPTTETFDDTKPLGRSGAKAVCTDAARNGKLTLRGGIKN